MKDSAFITISYLRGWKFTFYRFESKKNLIFAIKFVDIQSTLSYNEAKCYHRTYMTVIQPFKGILYNPEKVCGDDVMCPPYDIISDEIQEFLYNKSPYNIIRIDHGKHSSEIDKYVLAKEYLNKWIEEGVLLQEKEPCFYGYEVQYSYKNKNRILKGINRHCKARRIRQRNLSSWTDLFKTQNR